MGEISGSRKSVTELTAGDSAGVTTGRVDEPADAPYDGSDPCGTMFLVHAVDDDLDGEADPHPDDDLAASGALDVWPRVYLEHLGDSSVPLDDGERYLGEAIVDSGFLEVEELEPGVPTPLTTLELLFVPGAIHQLADGSEELPRGSWAITVVQLTGQTWTVPDELADHDATSSDFEPGSQAVGIELS